jgi:hypothetical protein
VQTLFWTGADVSVSNHNDIRGMQWQKIASPRVGLQDMPLYTSLYKFPKSYLDWPEKLPDHNAPKMHETVPSNYIHTEKCLYGIDIILVDG